MIDHIKGCTQSNTQSTEYHLTLLKEQILYCDVFENQTEKIQRLNLTYLNNWTETKDFLDKR